VVVNGTGVITGGVLSSTVIFCDEEVELPQASIAVHVRVTLYSLPQRPGTLTSLEVIVAEPHASLAVGELNDGVAGHSIVALAPTPAITGPVVSWTVIVCEATAVLPHGSEEVHVRVNVPVLPQPVTLVSMKLKLAVLHASVALGVLNTGAAGHWIVALGPTPEITGAVRSITVIVWDAFELLPHGSEAVHVRVKAPVVPHRVTLVSMNVSVDGPHASVAVGELNDGVAGHAIVAGAPTPVITGAVLSITVIVWARLVLLPHASVAVHVRVKTPVLPQPVTLVSRKPSVSVLQPSVAVGVVKTGTAGQAIVVGPGKPAITGAPVSVTVIVCVQVAGSVRASLTVYTREIV